MSDWDRRILLDLMDTVRSTLMHPCTDPRRKQQLSAVLTHFHPYEQSSLASSAHVHDLRSQLQTICQDGHPNCFCLAYAEKPCTLAMRLHADTTDKT